MTIANAITDIQKKLPSTVKLVAVSKFKPNEAILEAYSAGQRDFAENRPQELKQKMIDLPKDISWHFIGHLQTNKIKMIIDDVSLIHSVDSLRLATEINREASARSLIKDCLLQVHIASEDTKQGFSKQELIDSMPEILSMKNIRVCGLMGMASFVEDRKQISEEFSTLKRIFDEVKEACFKNCGHFNEISMGMSSDYELAIEQGSTIVRVGSMIFGGR